LSVNFQINFNNENIEADANFNFAVADTRSNYVWLLGCQDCPADRSINKIISTIQPVNPELLLLNFGIFDESEGKTRNTAYDHTNGDIFTSLYKFFICTHGSGPGISSNVFRNKYI
jgi:hypothetical protein